MVLLDNREVKQGWEPLKETVAGMFKKYDADIVSMRRWDERGLAYAIRGQTRGTYLLVYYSGVPDNNTSISRELELSETVLRHMTSTCEEIPADAYEPEAEFDIDAIPEPGQEPATEPAPDEKAEADKAEAGKAEADKTEADKTEADKAEAGKTEAEPAAGETSAEAKPAAGEAAAEAQPGEATAVAAEATETTTETATKEDK